MSLVQRIRGGGGGFEETRAADSGPEREACLLNIFLVGGFTPVASGSVTSPQGEIWPASNYFLQFLVSMWRKQERHKNVHVKPTQVKYAAHSTILRHVAKSTYQR